MHVLHKIVVEAKSAAEAAWKAREAIEAHQPEICDYYDDAAGHDWGEKYADPLSSRGDKNRFFDELEEVQRIQEHEAFLCLLRLRGVEPMPNPAETLEALVAGPYKGSNAYLLDTVLRLAVGTYQIDSGFYDAVHCTALVTDELRADVHRGVRNLWMLFFDLHR